MLHDNVLRGTIDNYIELLLKWNEKINLISKITKEELIDRHIIDCLQLRKYINEDEIIYDIGSGAGFPGLMLSYAGIKQVHLVEKCRKKTSFLRAASVLSENIVEIHNVKSENLIVDKCNVITARGYTSLENIFASTIHIADAQTKYILLKGRNLEQEINKAFFHWDFKYIIHKSITSDEGHIIEIEQLKPNGKKS